MERTTNTKENILNKVKIDLIVIGNPNSGKTSLIKRYIDGESTHIFI
jgi:GTPase SAR1 family protein